MKEPGTAPDRELIAALYAAGRAAWPALTLAVDDFAAHVDALQEKAQASEEPLALATLRAPDLFLACACVCGDPQALRIFDEQLLSQVPAFVERLRLPAAEVEELTQALRVKLLAPPEVRLRGYSGRAALKTYLRTTAVNSALHVLERVEQRQRSDRDEDWFAALPLGPVGAAEAELLKGHDGALLAAAVRAALRSLAPDERELLRRHFKDGLSLEAIAAESGLHRVTLWRKLRKVIASLRRGVLTELEARAGLAPEQAESLAHFVASRLNLSLSQALAPEPARGAGPGAPPHGREDGDDGD